MADILVADDTRSIRSTLSLLLEEEGHTVRLAPDGESALAEYRRKRPDMLLLDTLPAKMLLRLVSFVSMHLRRARGNVPRTP